MAFAEQELNERYPTLAEYSTPLKAAEREIVGREVEINQMMAAMKRPELSNVLLLAPPGAGKLLPLATPIPTPSGWTTMGELAVGDQVLGRDGRPTNVVFVSEVEVEPELYDITFSDGQVVTACADHQWVVSVKDDYDARRASRSRTLEERRNQAEACRQGLEKVKAREDLPKWSSAGELLALVSSVEVPWTRPSTLYTFLVRHDVANRPAKRSGEQAWKNRTRVNTVHVMEFDTQAALAAMLHFDRNRPVRARMEDVPERVLTTAQMLAEGVRRGKENRARFIVRMPEPLQLPEADLGVDPYVLGAWLGDGNTTHGLVAHLTCADPQIVSEIVRAGYDLQSVQSAPSSGKAMLFGFYGLGADLDSLGLIGVKRIPGTYLRASYEQRLALLQGLMDTDGTISANGACSIALSDPGLADDVEELLHTLGIKVGRTVRATSYVDAAGQQRQGRDSHRMCFTTDQRIFRLERKVSRLPEAVRDTQRLLYITSIEPVDSQPGRCIQVDNADSTYLCGTGFVPTHNTSLVQAAMLRDSQRTYKEVDLARMIANLPTTEAMAARLKLLFDEAEEYSKSEGHELVLFIDEFHQVVQLSPAAVEALKPVLAASGARGLRVIAATTFEEYQQNIASNLPLVERLQEIRLEPPSKEVTVQILRGMAQRYEVGDQFHDDRLFELIYEYTERYMPASTQPRKAIRVLDAMVGWHRLNQRPMDKSLLADVLLESTGINVTFRVNATKIQEQLDSKVISQQLATRTVANRLQLCVADLHDKDKPISSFLMLGSSGVGKMCADYTRVPVLSDDGSVVWKSHGELVPGDRVFNRAGDPVRVLGHFPQGVQDIYRVTFWDGRHLDVGGPHLWPVYTSKMRIMKHAGQEVDFRVMTTKDMYDQGVLRPTHGNSLRGQPKFFVPAGGAVQWPERNFEVDPWVLGVLIGNGSLTQPQLTLSSDDAQTVHEMGQRLGVVPKSKSADDYSWLFPTGERWGRGDKLIQTRDYLASVPELIGVKSGERRIPKAYLTASVEQRWELVRGLFDTDGTISNDDRRNISYSTFSKGLAEDLRELLFSLGVSNSLNAWTRTKDDGRVLVEYDVHVKVGNLDKAQFFSLPRKKALALSAVELDAGKQRVKKFDMLGIVSIEKLPEQHSASCIYVDDPEHLYQAGEFVVTHNTELVKQLANLLFGDAKSHLIRFDMSEYANDDTLDYFRQQLTRQVSAQGHAVLLFDEIEKASGKIVRVLLQVLDDGRLTSEHGRQVSFLNTYIVLTTNAGSEIFETIAQYNVDDDGSGEQLIERMSEIRRSLIRTQSDNKFPPELLGRIDQIVPFQPLSRTTQSKIVRRKLGEMRREVMAKHGVRLQIDERVLEYLIENKTSTESNAGGARVAISRMTEEVTTAVATFINANPQEKVVRIDIVGKMRSEDKEMLKSEAHVVVSAAR